MAVIRWTQVLSAILLLVTLAVEMTTAENDAVCTMSNPNGRFTFF